ncbi:peptidylprolyl isomerase [Vibrio sp. qd031]|jgi:peptidyl-prolyl cis-trans isomerase B (cyclophilin B)|uniref:Peptidyl-prolyl cis-trans isomerase n=1 Tax=Vibrio ulleungensis TaxID=2807619 RepID=A0ABS2HH50_9VIBR|nr:MULTISPECIES: peptidylprolyl isomerase [Vibrio]MBM7036865.1 peptidylprolyl isomerase [Vibrio ulleungensis]ORT50070.1 peptidylprolyl isomerase [Vibrio sp. qd031]
MITLHTNFGDIKIDLYEDKAPETAANFLQYCKDGFYDNTLFHRVIDGFMVQGGGMTSGLKEKSSRAPIKNEANNGLSNKVGTLAMARTMEPHSASSQFFINVNNNTFLDFTSESLDGWGYCVFGEVADEESMQVVNKIKGVSTGTMGMHQDVPLEEVVITGSTVE